MQGLVVTYGLRFDKDTKNRHECHKHTGNGCDCSKDTGNMFFGLTKAGADSIAVETL